MELTIGETPEGLFDPATDVDFRCVFAGQRLVGLLADPEQGSDVEGLVVTSPGAGGGPGPADPVGGGGGGTYGGALAYLALAHTLPRQGIAVLLLHYPDGYPGDRDVRVRNTVDQMEALVHWYQQLKQYPSIPTVLIGWSMGGAVAIETAARMLNAKASHVVGVATIASQTQAIQRTSLKLIAKSGASLLLMAGSADSCLRPACTEKIAKMAGVVPEIFPGEEHDVASAFGRLVGWLPEVMHQSKAATTQGQQDLARPCAGPPKVAPKVVAPKVDKLQTQGVHWDPVRKSPDVSIHDDGSTVQAATGTRAQWHAAFLQAGTEFHLGLDPVCLEFMVEHAGAGFVEIGIATRNSAKRSALHWRGLRNTHAWTYASTGDRFCSADGADEDMWRQPFGEPYHTGDAVKMEFGDGKLSFYRNGSLQGTINDFLPQQNIYVGATLSAGTKLKLLTNGLNI